MKRPQISICKGTFSIAVPGKGGKPYFGANYNFNNAGFGYPCDTLEEAFDRLEEGTRRDGFTLEQCEVTKWSDFRLEDRPGADVQPELF